MARHAPARRDYSPACDVAPGAQTGHTIIAGLTLWNPAIATGSVALLDLSGAQNGHILMQGATLRTRTAPETRSQAGADAESRHCIAYKHGTTNHCLTTFLSA